MATCPICRADNEQCVESVVSAEEASQAFVLAQADHERHQRVRRLIVDLWQGNSCSLVRCGRCNLRYAWPFVAGNEEFYNLAYPTREYPKTKWDFSATIRLLEEQTNLGQSALEVGAGFGYFLESICPRFFAKKQVLATEYNAVACDHLRTLGYTAYQGDLRSVAFADLRRKFDTIFMFQVLEHMDNLDVLVDTIAAVASDSARLFITVPNPVRIRFNETHGSLIDMPPNHISRWSPESLAVLARRMGFSHVSVRQEPFSLHEFLKEDLIYSHMRRAQSAATIANWSRRAERTRSRRALEAVLALLAAPLRIPAWMSTAHSRSSLGGSLLAYMWRGQ